MPITRYHILKYKLWQKYNSICPYTLVNIPLENRLQELFTAQWEVEHITPRSVVLDNSFAKLCHTSINNLKNNQIPYEFFEKALISLSKSPEDKHPIYSNTPIFIVDVATLMLILKLKWTQIIKRQAIPYHL